MLACFSGLLTDKKQACEAFSTAMLLVSGITHRLIDSEHGLPQHLYSMAEYQSILDKAADYIGKPVMCCAILLLCSCKQEA